MQKIDIFLLDNACLVRIKGTDHANPVARGELAEVIPGVGRRQRFLCLAIFRDGLVEEPRVRWQEHKIAQVEGQ